ncbi:small RNA-binding protein 11, chloroplastic-like [Durio zibethinus]|uniref:Small RNA-binding protein 11, chloroplastic-like n=1 Tax=Durio zibethinus TaxID=66656 RepID=A0A6P5ZJ42_DURZI|nr:small RNA-binding protein 11, chloroplastic-like [Durio zibethinus]XP_022752785.1 small RNA-binding protein 11, chloroplastic-like [Durio zibethinus]
MAKRLGSRLFINKLSYFTTRHELKTLFSQFGVVKDAKVIRDPKTLRSKGFGFVTFETESEAQKAMKAMNGRFVRARMMFVEFANDRSPEIDSDS